MSLPYLATMIPGLESEVVFFITPAGHQALLSASGRVASMLERGQEPKLDSQIDDARCCGRGGLSLVGSVAVVEVAGPVIASMSRCQAEMWGCTSQDALAHTLRRVRDDANVKGVALKLDCPGGSAPGSEELIGLVAEIAAKKPMAAVVGTCATSLAAFLSAACREVVASQNAVIGSIGEVMNLVDSSKAFEMAGLKAHAVTEQRLKPVGAPGVPITQEMIDNIAALVRDQIEPYIADYAARRGLTPESVRALQGGVFSAKRAVELKLIDRVARPSVFIAEFAARVATTTSAPTEVEPPESADGQGQESGDGRGGTTMSLAEFAAQLAGLKPDEMAQAARHVTSNAALAGVIGTQIAAEKNLVEKPKAATIAELKAAFKNESEFVLDAAERQLSLPEARAEFSGVLQDRLSKANATIGKLQADLASRPTLRLGNPPVSTGEKPADAGADAGEPKFMARLKAKMATGMLESAAVAALLGEADKTPEIMSEFDEYSKWLDAHPSKRRAG